MRTPGSANSNTFCGSPPATGDTHSTRWPSTSITRDWSGESERCEPPFMPGANGFGSPPAAGTEKVCWRTMERKTTAPPSAVQRRKCPPAPMLVSWRGSLPSAFITQISARPLRGGEAGLRRNRQPPEVRVLPQGGEGELPAIGRERRIDVLAGAGGHLLERAARRAVLVHRNAPDVVDAAAIGGEVDEPPRR